MKTSKLIIAMLAVAAIAGIAIGASGCKKESSTQTGGQTVKYTCSMHPEVVQDKPGSCPKCGMKLIEKR
jgi:Cu(I)/Ag(I) efflux system membrane fusion protein